MKDCGKFQQNLSCGFQFSLAKNSKVSSNRREGRNSNFFGWFRLKEKLLEEKMDASVSCPDSKELRKVSAKSESWFPIQHKKNWVNFLWAGEKVKISNSIGCFCLKDKLPEQKTDTAVSCPDSKELWKVSAKSKPWFPIQHKKIGWIFFEQARRSKFQISSVSFV